MFDYNVSEIQVPYVVAGQLKRRELWFNDEMKEFEMRFYFPQEVKKTENSPPWHGKLLWRYTIEYVDGDKRVLTTGYFKLNEDLATELNLHYYAKNFQVKWIRFTVFYVENPQLRAWFSPIRGKHFESETTGMILYSILFLYK